jgi:hypothetical protein
MRKPFVGTEVPRPKRDFAGYGRRVPRVTWSGGARVAVSIVINYEEGSEYAHRNGDGRNDGLVEMTYAMDPSYRDLCAWFLPEQRMDFRRPVTAAMILRVPRGHRDLTGERKWRCV